MYRRALRKKNRSESIRQSFGVVAVGVLLGAGLFAIADYFTARHWVRPATTAARNAAEIYTGSVLYMPPEGSNCRQMLFDNNTGRFTDKGSVDCENAAYRGVDGNLPKQWSSDRTRVIANGFRQHWVVPLHRIGRPRDFGYSPRRPGQQVSGVLAWRSSNGF